MSTKCIVVTAIAVVLIAVFCAVVDQPSNWVFDPKALQEAAQRGIAAAGPNATDAEIIKAVVAETARRYPRDVTAGGPWFFNNAGGAMGSMTVLHASFSEYLIIFGTAVGTEGHTGRFFAEDFFTIISGEQWAYPADSHTREVYAAGEQHFLPRMVAKQYRMPGACWALEYARGNIPSMLFFGFADTLSSTLDLVTLWQTVHASATHMIANALRGKI